MADKNNRRLQKIEIPSVTGYIYIMSVPDSDRKMCYVGQSAAQGFQRLEQHYKWAFKKGGEKKDASVEIIRDWPLKFINIDCYQAKDGSWFGFPKEVYEKFYSIFQPVGGAVLNQSQEANIIRKEYTEKKIQIQMSLRGDTKPRAITLGEMLDAAEILWTCKMRLLGYTVLNEDMGGQTSTWQYLDVNGNPIKITKQKTNIDQIISILLTNNLSQQDIQVLQSLKKKVDPLLEKVLDENLAEILAASIERVFTNTRNPMSDDAEADLRKKVSGAVADVLTGQPAKTGSKVEYSLKANNSFAKLMKQLQTQLTPREKELMGDLVINEKIVSNHPIIQDITRKLTTTIIGASFNKKLTKGKAIDIKIYIQKGLISIRGYNGEYEKQGIQKSFGLSVEQLIQIPHYNDEITINSLLSGPIPIPDFVVSDDIKWQWAAEQFWIMFKHVRDKKEGIVSLAESGAAERFMLVDDGDLAVLTSQPVNGNLSVKMLKEYEKFLSYNNLIIREWRKFFSNMWAVGDDRWAIKTINEGNVAYLQDIDMPIEGLTEDPVLIGFFIEDPSSFFTKGSTSVNKKYVLF